jgi:hypothetical protein
VRGFGILVLVLGVFAVFGALVMDVSVPSGVGRVNNLGLMAERQNYTIIGSVMLIAGLLMVMLGRRQASPALDIADSKSCPMCAESIKRAAIKCRHCGTDLDADQVAGEPDDNTPTANKWAKKDSEDSYAGYWILSLVVVGLIIFTVLSRL